MAFAWRSRADSTSRMAVPCGTGPLCAGLSQSRRATTGARQRDRAMSAAFVSAPQPRRWDRARKYTLPSSITRLEGFDADWRDAGYHFSDVRDEVPCCAWHDLRTANVMPGEVR